MNELKKGESRILVEVAMSAPTFVVGDRVRLARELAKVGQVMAVTGKGTALVVERDRGKCKGDYMRYPVDWWEEVV